MKTKLLSVLCASALVVGGLGTMPVFADGVTTYVDQTFANGKNDLYSTGKVNQVLSDGEIFSNDKYAVWNYALKPDGALRLRNGGSGQVQSYAQVKFDKAWTAEEDVQMEFKFMMDVMSNTTFQFRPYTNDAATTYATELFSVTNAAVRVGGEATSTTITDGGVWNRVVIKTDIENGTYSVSVNGTVAGGAKLPATTIYGLRFGHVNYPDYKDNVKKFASIRVDDFKVQTIADTYLEDSTKTTVNHTASLNFNNDIAADKLGTITVTDESCTLLDASKYSVSLDKADSSVVNVKFDASVAGAYTVDYSGIDADLTGSVGVNVKGDAATEYYMNEDFGNGIDVFYVLQANNIDSGVTTDDIYVYDAGEVWSEYNANGALKTIAAGATAKRENYASISLSKPYYKGTRATLELKFKSDSTSNNQLHIRPYRATSTGEAFGVTLFETNGSNIKFLRGTSLTNVAKTKEVTNVGDWNMARIEFYEDGTSELYINGEKIADGNVPDMANISGLRVLGARLKGTAERVNCFDDLKFYTASDEMLLEGSNLESSNTVSKKIYLDFETAPTEESLSNIVVKQNGKEIEGAVVSAVKNSIDDTVVEVILGSAFEGECELDYTGVADADGNTASGTLSFEKAGTASPKVYYEQNWTNGISALTNNTILNASSYTKDTVYIYDTESDPASCYDDGMLKINNKGNGSEAYYKVNFDTPWTFTDGDMQLELKLKADGLVSRNISFQPSFDGTLKNMILFDQTNLKLSNESGGWDTYPISDYKDEWMYVVVKTEGKNFTVSINNQEIGTGVIPLYDTAAAIDGIRFLDKIWSASADKYSYWDEIKVQRATAMYLENEDENSGKDKETYILDFNNALNPYSAKTVSVTCNGEAVSSDLYTVTTDSVDKTRLILTLNQYAPAGEYTVDYAGVMDFDNTQAEGSFEFTRVKEDFVSDIRLTDNLDGTATAAVDTVIYNGTKSYALILAVYDEDEFTGEKTLVDVVINDAKNYSGQKSFTCTVNAAEDQLVQACLWTGLDTMVPCAMKWKTM